MQVWYVLIVTNGNSNTPVKPNMPQDLTLRSEMSKYANIP